MPDGPMRMWFGGEYRVVEAPNRLVYSEQTTDENGDTGDDGHATEVRVELSEVADGTRVVMTHAGIPSDSPGGWAGRWRSTNSPPTLNAKSS